MARYLSAENRMTDDFERRFTHKEGEIVYDARTIHGPWACMTHDSWVENGAGLLGVGHGQVYRRNKLGELVKVGG